MTADLSGIRSLLAGIEGERWEYMPAMTDDAIIMHRVYDDEGHCIAECSSPTLAAFIAAAPSTVAGLLAVVERVEGLAKYLETLADGDKHYAALIRAALAGEGK